MEILKERILKDGMVIENGDILKVDSFIDHQVDVALIDKIAKNIIGHLKKKNLLSKINKIITIETSGIVLGTLMADKMQVPLVYARKKVPITLIEPLYSRKIVSPTKKNGVEIVVSSKYLKEDDSVYVVDDFLATGVTSLALMEIMKSAGANIIGFASIIENSFLQGRELLKEKFPDIDIYACVRIKEMHDSGEIIFYD